MQPKAKIGWVSAAAVVVANMIGTGAFTTLGIQLSFLSNTWSILLLWITGGLMALFGAMTYAELGVRLPRSGGEYHFLSRIFHPFLGYLSGWVSLSVGFAASIALAAMAIGDYLGPLFSFSGRWLALLSIVLISAMHSVSLRYSSRFQNLFTVLKLLLVVALISGGLLLPAADAGLDWSPPSQADLLSPAAAVSLVLVMYAFSGWNAATYIIDEIRDPARNLPRALVAGTVLVSLLFVLLQLAFLRQAPLELLQGQVEVGQIVASLLFGSTGGKVISILITILLVASISAMIWVGPRVTRAMAEDHPGWAFFASDNKYGIPVRAIWLQAGISLFLVATSSFEQVLVYSGFVLQLFTFITVAGLFRLRSRSEARPRWVSPGYPFVQLIFLLFSGWMLVFLLIDRPYESMLGLLNLLAGALSWWWNRRRQQARSKNEETEADGHTDRRRPIVPLSHSRQP